MEKATRGQDQGSVEGREELQKGVMNYCSSLMHLLVEGVLHVVLLISYGGSRFLHHDSVTGSAGLTLNGP